MIKGLIQDIPFLVDDDFFISCENKKLRELLEKTRDIILIENYPQSGYPILIFKDYILKLGAEIKSIKLNYYPYKIIF